MSTINGANQHNVEDILASIRSTIGDEPGFRSRQSSTQSVPLRRDLPIAEEAAEFELPAIFKPGHQAQASRPNIFGRLTEVLKSPSEPEPERSRTVVRFEPAGSQGRMIEPPAAAEPRMSAPTADLPSAKVLRENAEMKRVMPSFYDTRLNRMGEMSRVAATPKPVEPPPPEPELRAPYQAQSMPPRLPEAPLLAGGDAVEDAAAQLLRPILKQWLTENMPKIVERALRSEGIDFPSVPPQQDVRKTLR
jgi:cell pole-organizing protein PopZ